MRKILYLLTLITLTACVNEVMTKFPLTIYMKGELVGQNENDLLPVTFTKLIQPIKFGDSIFIPEVKIIRMDLPKEMPYSLEVPISIENYWKKKLKTYDFSCLKDDYDQNLPKMKLGKYLVKKGVEDNNKAIKPIISANARVFLITLDETKTVDTTIEFYKSLLKSEGVINVIIMINNIEKSDKNLGNSDLFNKANEFSIKNDNANAIKKYNEIRKTDSLNSEAIKKLSELEEKTLKQPLTTKCGTTLDLGYAIYYGPTKLFEGRCVMHGNGTLKFKEKHEIPLINKSKLKIAYPGDYVTGRWEYGRLMNGTRSDKHNTTEVIYGT